MSSPLKASPTGSSLDPAKPESWAHLPHQKLFAIERKQREELQLTALQLRFDQLKGKIGALSRLVDRQGVDRIDQIADALPLFFDHRVLKSYPLALIETRNFEKLTAWLNRLTTLNLLDMDLEGLKTLDDWLDRLDDFGMIIGHSTGTTGKLSFIPRSKVEWPAWSAAYNESMLAATGVDPRTTPLPTFFPGYRGGHQMLVKMMALFDVPGSGGGSEWHTLYNSKVSSDLLSLAARMQTAEDQGELDRLGLDPALLKARDELIAQGRRRQQDLQAWFEKLIDQYRGRRVKITGPYSELTRIAQTSLAKGLKCSFSPDSIILSGGGMKGYKDAPANWEDLIKEFFGINRICSIYGMSECAGTAPQCSAGFYHFLPFTIPVLLDRDAVELPREGVHTGRMALFDLLAQTYWGGFISGDQVTMHWDEDCACGWKGPRIGKTITRFAEMEGGDDKITCAGSTQAYSEFMDYVAQV